MRTLAITIALLAGLAASVPARAQQTVSVAPTLVAPAGSVTITWSGIAQPSATNFVRFCLPSLCAGTYHLPAATASGSMPVTLPSPGSMPPEAWTVRLTTSSGGVTNGNVLQVGRTIVGTVTVSGTPLAGVAISAPGGSCTSTNGSGQYSCLVPHGWTGNVTPSASGYLFTPASRSYSSLANNPTAQNFSAATAYPVTGTVTLGGSPLAAVTFTPTGSAVCGATNGSGQYLCNVPAGWTGSITPTLAGHIFSPASRNYSAVLAAQTAQDYAATAIYQVSGTVTSGGSPLAGVTMGATNGVTCSSTNGSGQYSCTVNGGWSGSVTPSLSGYLFTPASTSYTSVGANQTTNYTATPVLQVSGTATLNGLPLPNVALGTTGGGSCSSTNALGQFSCIVPQGWTGDLTPSGMGYTFTPALRSYISLATSQTSQDFAGATDGSAEPMFFVHVDHLNTPRAVYDANQQLRWMWEQTEPFGVNVPDENPSSLGTFEFALRFPGQYADKESNLHYNYFRDYDPSLGRFGESDPIGLRGGLNTYLYVHGEPLRRADVYGLKTLPEKLKVPKSPQEAVEDAAKRGKGRTCVELTKGKPYIECKLCCADPRRPVLEKLAEPGTTCRENCDREHGIQSQTPVPLVCLADSI
jgi:RHS repeat-associated protein